MSSPSDLSAGAGLLSHILGFLESSATPVVVVDESGVITYVNAGAALLLDYPVADLVGRSVDVLVPDRSRPGHAGLRAGFQRESAARPMGLGLQLTARRRDGSEVPVEISLTTTELADGRRWTVAGVTDISERIRADAQVAELSRAYLTLAQLNQAVVRAPDRSSLFAETCRIAVEQGGYAGAFVAVPDAAGNVVIVARDGRLGTYMSGLRIVLDPEDPRGFGPTAVAVRENRSCFSSDFLNDDLTAPWHASAALEGIRASASLPLRENGVVVAALTLYSARQGVFDKGVGELLEQVADNVSYAIDGFAAVTRLERETAQRRDLMRRLVTAQDTERARIAADIHDDSVQSLAAVELRLGLLRRRMGDSAPDLVPMMDQVSHTIRAAASGLRNLLFELEPAPEGEGWVTSVRVAAEQVFEDLPVTCSVRAPHDVVLPDAERLPAMRIVKEALLNVRKHARATHVDIVIVSAAAGVEVSVTDDGVGLPLGVAPEHLVPRRGHRGLATMRDRASAAGGWCRLERVDTGGARLRFFIPTA
ncbi:MAG: GAF domain-containing protein [Actinomycetota bacterium]|nr:GAF domain-containing protein [Actinomycetota bacterium]